MTSMSPWAPIPGTIIWGLIAMGKIASFTIISSQLSLVLFPSGDGLNSHSWLRGREFEGLPGKHPLISWFLRVFSHCQWGSGLRNLGQQEAFRNLVPFLAAPEIMVPVAGVGFVSSGAHKLKQCPKALLGFFSEASLWCG